ncbi:M15 family metallopeptidase [Arsenicicoccus piscis]|uniref:M15 family metallopeptidase n=1 Tax=Arsenicicoccus piscis TaxID=673954 RepID=UPI0024E08128|nr:M15 family metallopeptidase [Arsenicicoccus piscis]
MPPRSLVAALPVVAGVGLSASPLAVASAVADEPGPAGSGTSGPSTSASESAHESASAPAHESASAPAHESASAPAHESASAPAHDVADDPSPAPSPTGTRGAAPTPSSHATTTPAGAPVRITAALQCAVLCPSPTAFVAEHGRFQITGSVQGLAAGSGLSILAVGPTGVTTRTPVAVAADGRFEWSGPVAGSGSHTFYVTTNRSSVGSATGGSVGGGAATGALVAHVAPLAVSVTSGLAPRSYTLANPVATGRISAGVAGRMVWTEALLQGRWTRISTATTGAGGAYSIPLAWGAGKLNAVSYRVGYTGANHPRTVYGPQIRLTRFPELRATVRAAKASDVPLSYRAGCPVGPAQLTRIDLNYVGFDGNQHRGFLIVRSTRAAKFIDVFTKALNSRFPMRVMQDPSAYGNDDYRSMAADNTYAFSCRRVTGNPLSMSPHSYGQSIDVNTVENPYRQPNGVWVPANGRAYVNRSWVRPGMLVPGGTVPKAFAANGFRWLTGFDWQHFQL